MTALLTVWGLLLAALGFIRWADHNCEAAYQNELLFFQDLTAEIHQERLEMANRWATEDLQLISQGQPARGIPRGTPALVVSEYNRLMEAAPIPVELPQWINVPISPSETQ